MREIQHAYSPEDIGEQILLYLREHPRAQDTVEGIVQWWLLEQEIQRWTTRVEAALVDLVRRGLVLEHKGPDERNRYSLNPMKLAVIRAQLKTVNR